MNTNLFFLVAALTFQCLVEYNEAASFEKLTAFNRPVLEASSPEELLEELQKLVYNSVKNATDTLKSTFEDSKAKVSETHDNAKVDLKNENDRLLKEFEAVKAQAEAADADACIAGDEGEIDFVFKSYSLHTDYCYYGYVNNVDDDLSYGLKLLENLKELEPKLRKELENCGNSADCRDEVSGKISQTVDGIPKKVKYIVDDTTKDISLAPLNKCNAEEFQLFVRDVKSVIKEAQDCVDNKKHY